MKLFSLMHGTSAVVKKNFDGFVREIESFEMKMDLKQSSLMRP